METPKIDLNIVCQTKPLSASFAAWLLAAFPDKACWDQGQYEMLRSGVDQACAMHDQQQRAAVDQYDVSSRAPSSKRDTRCSEIQCTEERRNLFPVKLYTNYDLVKDFLRELTNGHGAVENISLEDTSLSPRETCDPGRNREGEGGGTEQQTIQSCTADQVDSDRNNSTGLSDNRASTTTPPTRTTATATPPPQRTTATTAAATTTTLTAAGEVVQLVDAREEADVLLLTDPVQNYLTATTAQRICQFPYEGCIVKKDLLIVTIRRHCYFSPSRLCTALCNSVATAPTSNSTPNLNENILLAASNPCTKVGVETGETTTAAGTALVPPFWWLPCYDLSTEFHLFAQDFTARAYRAAASVVPRHTVTTNATITHDDSGRKGCGVCYSQAALCQWSLSPWSTHNNNSNNNNNDRNNNNNGNDSTAAQNCVRYACQCDWNGWIIKPAEGTRGKGHFLSVPLATTTAVTTATTNTAADGDGGRFTEDTAENTVFGTDFQKTTTTKTPPPSSSATISAVSVKDTHPLCTIARVASPLRDVRVLFPKTPISLLSPATDSRRGSYHFLRGFNEVPDGQDRVAQLLLKHPLLVRERKFDLRIYVFVRSFYPFEVYMHKLFYARLANKPYSLESLTDREVALTVSSYDEDTAVAQRQERLTPRELSDALGREYCTVKENNNSGNNNNDNSINNYHNNKHTSHTISGTLLLREMMAKVQQMLIELFSGAARTVGGPWPQSAAYYAVDVIFDNSANFAQWNEGFGGNGDENDFRSSSSGLGGNGGSSYTKQTEKTANGENGRTENGQIEEEEEEEEEKEGVAKAGHMHKTTSVFYATPVPKLLEVNFMGDWAGMRAAFSPKTGKSPESSDTDTKPKQPENEENGSEFGDFECGYELWADDLLCALLTDLPLSAHRLVKLPYLA